MIKHFFRPPESFVDVLIGVAVGILVAYFVLNFGAIIGGNHHWQLDQLRSLVLVGAIVMAMAGMQKYDAERRR